jgi:Kdo2-lipid IVA lauroyltransferase/acyltransferase
MSDTIPAAGSRKALKKVYAPATLAMRAVYAVEYALFWGVMTLFRALGLERASDLGGWLARKLGPMIPVTKRARKAMARAFPEMSEAERERHIVAMWDNLGRTFAEYPHLEKFWAVKPGARIEIAGMEHALAAIAKNKGGLFASGHCGNWELMGRCIKDIGHKGTLVYRPPNNPWVDAWIAKQRRIGLPTLAAKGGDGVRAIIKTLKENAFIAMLVDQKANDGISVPLFGRAAMTSPTAPSLSIRHGAPIVPVWCERLSGQRFRVTVYPEIAQPNTGDKAKDTYELALRLNQFLEARIREKPSNWLWLHSRWPKD